MFCLIEIFRLNVQMQMQYRGVFPRIMQNIASQSMDISPKLKVSLS